MNTIDNNDFMILNSIIYKIYTNPDFLAMRKELLEQLKMIIDFDSAEFHLSKGDGSISLTSSVSYNKNASVDFSRVYENIDYSQGILSTGKSMVYRETDIISDKKRMETEYYKNVYEVNNWHYSLQLVLGHNERFLGVITFYRDKEKDDFKYSDVFKVQLIKDHLAYRIYQEQENNIKSGDKISIQEAVELYGLTKRESDILELLISGYSNKEICDQIVIANNTLKKHILNIYRKLDIKNRVQLIRMIKET
ncbi:helix-turn-helix transcriptional regulator [Clostridium sp. MD294]|uniref:response regulator transcription factor n=1 Tax=Clostridium sp. MD294 TaxID=97138 RepID=UPI0002CAB75E|nr:helix-turn-helix transcriptional regulator [Clostridium sp. MD294]NDO46930.1 helix-turn-helix transcriptional regulator [Clostridium sp. MD294]USF31406.1 HTH-type transcriptional regulator MalT [Clostridium sp. MD294]